MHRQPVEYRAARLHNRSEEAWAVLERFSGAIATDVMDRLLMRMTERDARDLAAAMNLALKGGPEDAAPVKPPAERLV